MALAPDSKYVQYLVTIQRGNHNRDPNEAEISHMILLVLLLEHSAWYNRSGTQKYEKKDLLGSWCQQDPLSTALM